MEQLTLAKIETFTLATANSAVADIVAKVADGQLYAGEAYAFAALLEKIAKGIRKDVPISDNWQGRGATITLGNSVDYDYSSTPAWCDLEAKATEIKALQKQIEAEAQRLAKAGKPKGAVLTEDGEAFEVLHPKVTRASKVTVTLQKA